MADSASIQETIAARKRAMIVPRLIKGSEVLGRLWREGTRCRSEWSGICPCEAPSDFCIAKQKWLGLVRDLCGGPPYALPWNAPHVLSGSEGYLVFELMSRKMIEATGLTIRIARPGDRVPLRIGPKGTDFQTVIDLAEIDDDAVQAVAVDAVIKLQEVFGAK
jgi:hypothetical protein